MIDSLGNYTPAEKEFIQNGTVHPTRSPDELLQIFRDQFAVHFPYAVISPHITASNLQDQQPWLYKMIIMVVSSHEYRQQIETGKTLISEISTAVSLFPDLLYLVYLVFKSGLKT